MQRRRADQVVFRWLLRPVLAVVLAIVAMGCPVPKQDRSAFVPAADAYDVRILRDEWGVAHVFGQTDADTAYGMAYAHSEDDWINMQDAVLIARGRMSAVHGMAFAPFDYLVGLFRVRAFVEAKYTSEVPSDVRAVLDAYADGINHYAARHPEKMPDILLPVTGKDILGGFVFKGPFFYELHKTLERLTGPTEALPMSEEGGLAQAPLRAPLWTASEPIGSNAFAVGPARSSDGATRLAINSHQPWEGPVAWYEIHVHSENGWNIAGGTFPGGPMIFSGHDTDKGWCHTVNRPDLADVFRLEMHPNDPMQYRMDGEWHRLQSASIPITIRLWGSLRFTVQREALWSVHGPALRTPNGVFAVRFAGYGDVGAPEQWFRMNKARSMDEFVDALRVQGVQSFNTVYADREGNLLYAYGANWPKRFEGPNWRGILPGDSSELLVDARVPFEDKPLLINPEAAVLQSCNSSPFHATVGSDNLDPAAFPTWMGIETFLTDRSTRALERYGGDASITAAEFEAYKFDVQYPEDSTVGRYIAELRAGQIPDDPVLQEAAEMLFAWDRRMARDSTAATLGYLAAQPTMVGERPAAGTEPEPAIVRLQEAIDFLMEHHGRIDVPWGQVMRLRRGDVDLPLDGAPECLRVVKGALEDDGTFSADYGDGLIMLVEWSADGTLRSRSIHNFGAATVDEASPHYADQAPMFAAHEWKPALLTEAAVRAHLKREYRPGELEAPWYQGL